MVSKTSASVAMPSSSHKIKPANITVQLRFTNPNTESIHSIDKVSPSLHPVFRSHEDSRSYNEQDKPSNDDARHRKSNTSNNVQPPPRKQLQDIRLLSKSADVTNSTIDDDCVFLISSEWYQHWHEYCESNGAVPYPNEINNWSLVYFKEDIKEDTVKANYIYNQCRFPLKPGLVLNKEFIVVSGEVWEALHCWYGGGPPLPRLVHTTIVSPQSSLSPRAVDSDSYLILHPPSSTGGRGVGADSSDIDNIQFKQWIDFYPASPLSLTLAMNDDNSSIMNTTGGQPIAMNDDSAKMILRVTNAGSNDCGSSITKISPVSMSDKLASNYSVNMNLTDDSIPSYVSSSSSAHLSTTVTYEVNQCNSCFVCGNIADKHCINCKAVYYCSVPCQKVHWKYHKTWCDKASLNATLSKYEFERIVPIGRRGKVGLFNLGNSCYMNSCLQCLSHIMPLTHSFLSQRYLNDLNVKSQDGTGGKLATEYAHLLLDLWFSNNRAVSMLSMKLQLGRIRQEYAGSQQHDAHEVVELLLDKLHEDLNRVHVKPYTERPEGDGTNDDAIAADAWNKHLLRENSIITDNVGSLMRSELTCPDCGKVSVCFEYQQTLQVAIPNRNTMRIIRVLFVPCTISKIFSRTSGLSSNALLKLMRYRMIIMRPILFAFKVDKYDKLGTVLKMATIELIRYSQHLLEDMKKEEKNKRDDSIYNALVGEDSSLYKTEAFSMYEMTSRGGSSSNNNDMIDSNTCLARYCREDEMVKDFNHNEGATLSMYSLAGIFNAQGVTGSQPQQQQPNILKVVLLQRKISDTVFKTNLTDGNSLDATSTSSAPSNIALSQILSNRLNYQLTGTPSILTCDVRWTMFRVRHCVWQQISRMIINDSQPFEKLGLLSEVVELIKEVESKGDLKKQFEFSRLLPLRLVTQFGVSKWNNTHNNPHEISRYHQNMAINSSSSSSSSILGSAVAATLSSGDSEQQQQQHLDESLALDKVLGETLPDDKNITLEQYFGLNEEFVFISMDWSGDWLRLLNEHEQKYITVHESCDDLNVKAQTSVPSQLSQQKRSQQQQLDNESIMTLESCLREHTQQETLDEANAWYCSTCKKHQCAKKNVKFWAPRLPNVLIIVLKRFEFRDVGSLAGRSGMMHREKIETLVDFPINGLDLTQFCAGSGSGNNNCSGERGELDMSIDTVTTAESNNSMNNTNNNRNHNNNVYDLLSVCNHYGRMGFGHYTAFARDSNHNNNNSSSSISSSKNNTTATTADDNNSNNYNEWYSFDDDVVERCRGDDSDVVSKSAYILFYRRRNGC